MQAVHIERFGCSAVHRNKQFIGAVDKNIHDPHFYFWERRKLANLAACKRNLKNMFVLVAARVQKIEKHIIVLPEVCADITLSLVRYAPHRAESAILYMNVQSRFVRGKEG